jgi:hypothetical protein
MPNFGVNLGKRERHKGIALHPKLDDGFTCARENLALERRIFEGNTKEKRARICVYVFDGDSEEKIRLSQKSGAKS